MLNKYKNIILDKTHYEPETLKQLYGLTGLDLMEVMALMTAAKTNSVHEDSFAFEKFVLAVNRQDLDFGVIDGVLVPWIWKALKVLKKVRPKMELSKEVQEYIKYVSNQQGYFIYPEMCTELDNKYLEVSKKLSKNPELLTDNTTEEVQAAKYLLVASE